MKITDKPLRWWQTLQARSGLTLLITAAILIEVMGAVQYIFAENGIRKEVHDRARAELKARNLEIQHVVSSVETAIQNMQWAIERSVRTPDSIYPTLERIIANNPVITGCAIAFEPDHFPSQGRWYEPFAGRKEGLSGDIVRRQIGSAEHDYHSATWYAEGLRSEGGHWTEPYIDDAGSKMMVCSYTMPVHDSKGHVVGVFCCDMSIEWLTDIFGNYGGSYTFLASRAGRLLACPDKTLVMTTTIQEMAEGYSDSMIGAMNSAMLAGDSGDAVVRDNDGNKSYAFYAPVDGTTGWNMAVIFPDKEIYAGLHRVGSYLTIFILVGLVLMIYIVWRTVRSFRRLQAVNAEKERIGSELRIASGIQMGMLPKTFPPYPDLDELAMFGTLVSAKEVGGDLYDFYVRDHKLFFCLGDVSGKGVPASLVMAVTRSLFRTVSAHTENPEQIMGQMNKAMSEMNESSMFVTLFIGVLNLTDGSMTYSNAGHCPPAIIHQGTVQTLTMDANIPVGLMPDWSFSRQQATLRPGCMLFLYTDGLTEAEDSNHRQYGEERMTETLRHTDGLTPRQLIEHMTQSVHTFVNGAEQSDDLTMLAIQFIDTFKQQP